MNSGVEFYCGLASEQHWNHHPVAPGKYACISPVTGKTERTRKENNIYVPKETIIIQDSGAFCDSLQHRLTFEEALDRQIAHAEKYHYADQVTHRASYDILIDEVWTDGNRDKRRWTVGDAEFAVVQTIQAAIFMANHKTQPVILSAQGVDATQYTQCVSQIIPYLDSGDILGLGGWCITGKMRKIMTPVFRKTILSIIPLIAKWGIKRVHIWGVIYPVALGELLWMCDQYEIKVSTDSAGPSFRPAMGSWGYDGWTDPTYKQPPVEIRGLERARHVEATRNWLETLSQSSYYKEPILGDWTCR